MPDQKNKKLQYVVLCLATAIASHVSANPLIELSIEQLAGIQVESASRYKQDAINAPAAVSVVDAEEIRRFGYRTLGEILSSMRGIYTSYDRYISYVGTRGFSRTGDYNTRILLLIDGIRQNDSLFSQAMAGTESPIDIDLISRVEFVPGAGSSVYGSNAFFGVINVITKNGGDYQGTETAAAAGSYKTGKLRITHGKSTDTGIDWLVSGSSYYQQGQNHFFPEHNNTASSLDSDRSGSVFAKIKNENFSLSLILGKRNKENPTASFNQLFNASGSASTDEYAAISGEYRKALSEALSLTVRAYAQQYRYQGNFIYRYDIDPAFSAQTSYTNHDQAEGSMLGGEFQLTSTHFSNQRIVLGTDYRRDTGVKQKNFDVQPYVSYLDSRVSGNTNGVYLQDEISLGDKFLINVGIRHDQMSGFNSSTNPRIGLVYKLQPQTAIKLLYGTAYRVPNAYELHYETNTTGGFRTNPNLKPETIRSRELVIEHALSTSQRVIASIYQNDVSHLISQRYDSTVDRYYFDNVSSVRAQGLEMEWTGRFSGGIMARLSASFQQAEDSATGQTLSNSPARLFKANLSSPFWQDKLRAGLEIQGVSSRKTDLGTEAPGFAIANLTFLAPKIIRNTDLSASIYNLLDHHYYDPAGNELSPISRVEQNGRNIRLKLNYHF